VGWTVEDINEIAEEHRELKCVAHEETHLRTLLEKCSDEKTSFEEGWALCGGAYPKLQLFVGGLASMFPNTATVESDFSLIGIEKNVYHQSLTNFFLKGILHAKQFNELLSLMK